jgi:hypothetical protein
VTDVRSKWLRISAIGILLISAVVQLMIVGQYWADFDSRLSCDRLKYWDEWISCLHGQSHLHIVFTEVFVGTWLIAGVGALLGRRLSPYISVVLPGAMLVGVLWWVLDFWQDSVLVLLPFSQPGPAELLVLGTVAGAVAACLTGPARGAWLLGLRRRGNRSPQRIPAA